MSTWKQLATQAAVGTKKVPINLDPSLAGYGEGNQEKQLLASLGLSELMQCAGFEPLTSGPKPVEECPKESKPICLKAVQPLKEAFENNLSPAIEEWLELAQRNDLVAPPAVLTLLLDLGSKSSKLRELVRAVLGVRGLWVAEKNDAWFYVFEQQPKVIGTFDEFVALQRIGHKESRQFLTERWSEFAIRLKVRILQEMRLDITVEDEPFLEAALSDPNKDVRLQAAKMLQLIPGSRLVKHAWEAARPCVTYQRSLLRSKMVIELPRSTPELVRDGFGDYDPKKVKGYGQLLLEELVSAVPPSNWNRELRLEPTPMLDAIASVAEKDVLTKALTIATLKYKDADWAEALAIKHSFERTQLVQLLSEARFEHVMLELVQSASRLPNPLESLHALCDLGRAWSPRASLAVWHVLEKYLRTQSKFLYEGQYLRRFPLHFHPSVFPQIDGAKIEHERWPEIWIHWAHVMRIRTELHQSIQ